MDLLHTALACRPTGISKKVQYRNSKHQFTWLTYGLELLVVQPFKLLVIGSDGKVIVHP